MIILFVLSKYAMYCLVCALAPRTLRFEVTNLFSFATAWGGIRFAIGVAFGLMIVAAYSFWIDQLKLSEPLSYILSFGVIRYVEWFLLLVIISTRRKVPVTWSAQRWVLIGVAASLASDGVQSRPV